MTAEEIVEQYKAVERKKNETRFAFDIRALKLPIPVREYRFAAEHVGFGPGLRQRLFEADLGDWRFDFCWPDRMLAFEIEGGIGTGRHTKPAGFIEDCRKYNSAQLLGWIVYRVPGQWVSGGQAINLLERALVKHERTTFARDGDDADHDIVRGVPVAPGA